MTGRSALAAAILLPLLAAGPPPAAGGPPRGGAVRAAVEAWVRLVPSEKPPAARVVGMAPLALEGATVAYVASLGGGGYCIAGADDLLLPVYLYAPGGVHDPANPVVADILAEIGRALRSLAPLERLGEAAPLASRDALERRRGRWTDLLEGRAPGGGAVPEITADPQSLELPLTAAWHQTSPYNDTCPRLDPGVGPRAVAGCVPIAMAQIADYWQWPQVGVGTHSGGYYPRRYSATWIETPLAADPGIAGNRCPNDWPERLAWSGGMLRMKGYWDVSIMDEARAYNSGTDYRAALDLLYGQLADARENLQADFGTVFFNWALIQDRQLAPPNGTADAEVAKLVHAMGIAANVRYGVCSTNGSSGASLAEHFRYDPDYYGLWDDAGFPDVVVEEVKWLRPVILLRGGHAWILYGYDKAPSPWLFLMNIGWGYNSHVWRAFDSSFPGDGWLETRIAPAAVVDFVGGSAAGDGSPADPYASIDAALAGAPDGGTLVFRAGGEYRPAVLPLVLDRPLTLVGQEVAIY